MRIFYSLSENRTTNCSKRITVIRCDDNGNLNFDVGLDSISDIECISKVHHYVMKKIYDKMYRNKSLSRMRQKAHQSPISVNETAEIGKDRSLIFVT